MTQLAWSRADGKLWKYGSNLVKADTWTYTCEDPCPDGDPKLCPELCDNWPETATVSIIGSTTCFGTGVCHGGFFGPLKGFGNSTVDGAYVLTKVSASSRKATYEAVVDVEIKYAEYATHITGDDCAGVSYTYHCDNNTAFCDDCVTSTCEDNDAGYGTTCISEMLIRLIVECSSCSQITPDRPYAGGLSYTFVQSDSPVTDAGCSSETPKDFTTWFGTIEGERLTPGGLAGDGILPGERPFEGIAAPCTGFNAACRSSQGIDPSVLRCPCEFMVWGF